MRFCRRDWRFEAIAFGRLIQLRRGAQIRKYPINHQIPSNRTWLKCQVGRSGHEMRTVVSILFSELLPALASAPEARAGGNDGATPILANVLQDISTEVALGIAATLALVVIFVVMRSRGPIRNGKKASSTTAQPFYPPPPKNPPLRPDQIVLRLERTKNREPAPLLVLPPRPVVAEAPAVTPPPVGAAPVDLPPPGSPPAGEKRRPSERALAVESLPVVRAAVGREDESAPLAVPSPELSVALLRHLEWKRFELLVQRYYEAGGLRAKCTCVGESGGVDIQLFRGEDPQPFSVVYCQACEGRAVPIEAVTALFALIPPAPVEIVFVASGSFSPGAQAFAQTKRITLLTGETLVARFNALPASKRGEILAEVTTGDYTTPTCRRCDLKLVLAAADEGQPRQWRCPRTPRCTFSLPVRG